MEEQIKDLRRLVIKAYHMNEVEWGEHNDIIVDGKMTVSKYDNGYYSDFHKSSGENWRRYYTYNYGCVCNFNRCGC